MGDIMGHSQQIESAYVSTNKTYDYSKVFWPIRPIIERADFTVANLEVTLARTPYTGYPAFSLPDALAFDSKKAGVEVMVSSNNHACDRGRQGIIRTLDILDSAQLAHTGTFRSTKEQEKHPFIWLEKRQYKIALLNYT